MLKRVFASMACLVLISGCAIGKNYNAERDALNSRVSSLQSQLQGKDREIGSLSDQLRSLQNQLESANKARLDAERRLDQATARLSSIRKSKTPSGYDKGSTDEYVK